MVIIRDGCTGIWNGALICPMPWAGLDLLTFLLAIDSRYPIQFKYIVIITDPLLRRKTKHDYRKVFPKYAKFAPGPTGHSFSRPKLLSQPWSCGPARSPRLSLYMGKSSVRSLRP